MSLHLVELQKRLLQQLFVLGLLQQELGIQKLGA
jgi:hypothetical protein